MYRLVALLLAFASLAGAREFRGTILGRSTDSTGAVVMGPRIQVTNVGSLNHAGGHQQALNPHPLVAATLVSRLAVNVEAVAVDRNAVVLASGLGAADSPVFPCIRSAVEVCQPGHEWHELLTKA